jgi:hypothetical protein
MCRHFSVQGDQIRVLVNANGSEGLRASELAHFQVDNHRSMD